MLYISLGDGAGAIDFYKHAQNLGTLLGAVLRIDVDRGDPYAIPADNPFVGVAGARGELWATGLRNPWRISIDRSDGTIYIPDVGEDRWEEVNAVAAGGKGKNFGWPVMEGSDCLSSSPGCDKTPYATPLFQYSHSDGCSIIGGLVYRGRRILSLRGHYVYSDFCSGFLRSFRLANGQAVDVVDWGMKLGFVNAFGEDGKGELYVLMNDGRVLLLEQTP